jgi:hypothetical protein
MVDGLNKEIELCKNKLKKISASELDLFLNVEKLFKRAVGDVEEYHHSTKVEPKGLKLTTRYSTPFLKNQSLP